MKRYRHLSFFLLSLSGIIGVTRGYRMIMNQQGNEILFPYPQNIMEDSIFANYRVMGWVLFFLIGIFSMLVLVCIRCNIRNYAYLIIVEGIFISFFTLTHILLTGFGVIHLIVLPLSLATIIIGILQTPKEF